MADDPNRPQRFLPPRDDFTYSDPSSLLRPKPNPLPEKPAEILRPNPLSGEELFDEYKRAPLPKLLLHDDSYFYLNITGQIESAHLSGIESLQVRFDFVAGLGWDQVHGLSSGASQFAYKARNGSKRIVWNFPFDLGYRSTSAKGWPQLVLTIVGPDFLMREVIVGYGNTHVPTTPGRHVRKIKLFRPRASSFMVAFIGWLKGIVAELIDPSRTLAKTDGREVTRMDSGGRVKVVFTISEQNMKELGYSCTN